MQERCENSEAERAYNEAEAQREEAYMDLYVQVCERCQDQWPATEINDEGVCICCLGEEEQEDEH